MKDLIQLQLLLICISWSVALIFWDFSIAMTVSLGGVTYFLPTLLAALVLTKVRKVPEFMPIALLVVEAHKILLVIIIMAAIYFLFPGINWVSYIIGLVLVTQVGLLMFRKSSYYE